MTMDGRMLWSRDPTAIRHAASTIKMLTALVVMDHARLSDTVLVPNQAEIGNGGVGLVAGQRLTVSQLLDMMLIHSANDAARALAIHVGGTQDRFVAMMNAKALAIGLKHTHAVDPDGFSGRETSTAIDLAVLGRHLMAVPVLRGIVGRASVVVPRPTGKAATYASSDLLMGHYAGLEGIKTGFTTGAGFCYVGAAKRGGVELLGVVLGTSSEAERFGQMRKLLDWGFTHVHVEQVTLRRSTRVVQEGPHRVTVHAAYPVWTAIVDAGGPIASRVVMSRPTAGPIRLGQRLATLVVSQDGLVLAHVPLLASQAVSVAPGSTSRVAWLGGIVAVLVLGGAAGAVVIAWAKGSAQGLRLEGTRPDPLTPLDASPEPPDRIR